MPLSWNEIRARAIRFGREWADAAHEKAEAQSFWNDFFAVFGKSRRHVASFEEPVKSLRQTSEFIDLIWPGVLIAEHKSRGKSLAKAETQAYGYIRGLIDSGRQDEAPRYMAVSDFATIVLHDLDAGESFTVPVAELHESVHLFGFIAGYERRVLPPEDPANIRAAEILADLHDALEDGGYPAADLEKFMVRVLFCLFAEDTGLFDQPSAFQLYIEEQTRPDGSDLGPAVSRWFEVLDTPPAQRQKNLDDRLAELPFVNGALFRGRLPFADFDTAMRDRLLRCCRFRWSQISPAVFGSLFQSIMEPRARRQIGAHYTSERDIGKLVGSLFMDGLRARLDKAGTDKRKLRALHAELGTVRVLDPACGCGNFLVVAYRELRKLEIDILARLHPRVEGAMTAEQRALFDVRQELKVDVSQFYGIELSPWPAKIAEVAMWLMDHQMNLEVGLAFGEPVLRLPLDTSATVVCGNALRMDWNEVLPAGRCSFVVGNPPFVGGKYQSAAQRDDMRAVWGSTKGAGLLDYVTAWYALAAGYLRGHAGRAALVSTNSITQGEQAGVLWNELFRRGVTIDFGHRTFPWTSEAKGAAHVHVVIVGFGVGAGPGEKRVYDYDAKGGPLGVTRVGNVSPYLTDGPDRGVTNRSKPLCAVPEIGIGNKPIDGGQYLFTPEEKEAFIAEEPASAALFRRWFGSQEFLNGIERWCLWVGGAEPEVLRAMPRVMERIDRVRAFRAESKSAPTRKIAATPTRFHVENIPADRFLVIPKVSSERRLYAPIGFMRPDALASDLVFVVPDATPFHFGVLHSSMHMAWLRQVGGRLESRYRYSAKLVYNNFPWPESPTEAQRDAVEAAAQAVLDARAAHAGSTLADLYDPLTMPADLTKAHAALDRAVDRCYRPQPFPDERRRFEFLFAEWERLTALFAAAPKKARRRSTPGGAGPAG